MPEPCIPELLEEAQKICREMLAADPNQPRILNLLGMLAVQERQGDVALACFWRAVQLDSNTSQWFSDLAEVLERKGRRSDAINARLRALRLAPEDPETCRLLGQTLRREGHLAEAVVAYQESLRLRPGHTPTMGDLGDALEARGHIVEALEQYEACLRLRPGDPETYRRIGQLRLGRREWRAALDAFQLGLRHPPAHDTDRAALSLGIGQALVRLGAFEDAVTAFRESLDIEPFNVDALRHLVCALELLGKKHDAARAWLSLGTVLDAQDRFHEAVAAYRQVIACKADCLDALIRLGSVHMLLGEPADAVRCLEAAVGVHPEHLTAHVKLGCALHLAGERERGWDELRWLSDPMRIKTWRAFEQPLWDGSPLEGRRILLWAMRDYGLGDTIQLVRYARHLKARGASRVIVECQQPLMMLIEHMSEVDTVTVPGGWLPAFDVHAPMMLVPSIDRTARDPRTCVRADAPYLSVEDRFTQFWREHLGPFEGKTIGLCWGAHSTRRDARLRSAPLSAFVVLAQVPNVRFVSLQIGPHADEGIVPPPGLEIRSVMSPSSWVVHTAGLIEALDLVITVDTMIAHLAGALGRPVWTLLPYGADWKWLAEPKDEATPWYPTMRLFRQTKAGVWSDVIERVRQALDEGATMAAV